MNAGIDLNGGACGSGGREGEGCRGQNRENRAAIAIICARDAAGHLEGAGCLPRTVCDGSLLELGILGFQLFPQLSCVQLRLFITRRIGGLLRLECQIVLQLRGTFHFCGSVCFLGIHRFHFYVCRCIFRWPYRLRFL